MTAIEVEVQVGTAPQLEAEVQVGTPTYTITSVLPTGPRGAQGETGPSAYETAVEEGFVGTEAEWLTSLVGAQGDEGDSAYEVAVAEGFVGDEAAWLESLVGEPGSDADATDLVATEAAARLAADDGLQDALDAEVLARSNADNALDTRVDALEANPGGVESVNSQTGVVVLDAADVGADPAGTAATAVAAEAGTRAAADTALDGRLDSIEAISIATDAEVAAAVAAEAALARNASNLTSGTVAEERIPSTIARDTEVQGLIDAAINALLDGAPAALDTLNELAAAVNDDAAFAASVTTALAGKQPLDADLTAIAALTTTSIGRSLLAAADDAALRSILGLGTAATQPSTAFQPIDDDLSAIAALTTVANRLPYSTGAGTWALTTFTAQARALLSDNTTAGMRQTLDVEIGVDVQAYNAHLAALATAGNSAVLAATTAAFLSADETKLDALLLAAQVPAGGTVDQILAKTSGVDYAYAWVDPPEGGGGGSGIVVSLVEGDGIEIDSTDPEHPIVSATGGGGGPGTPEVFAEDPDDPGTYISAPLYVGLTDPAVGGTDPYLWLSPESLGAPAATGVSFSDSGLIVINSASSVQEALADVDAALATLVDLPAAVTALPAWELVVDEPGTSIANFTSVAGTWAVDSDYIKQSDVTLAYRGLRLTAPVHLGSGLAVEADVRFPTSALATRRAMFAMGSSAAVGATTDIWTGLQEGTTEGVIHQRGDAGTVLDALTVDEDIWYRVRVQLHGYHVSVSIDGTMVSTAQSIPGTSTNPSLSNKLMLICYGGEVHYKNIKAWRLEGPA